MLDRTILAAHYKEYAAQPDEWVKNMETTKKSIITQVLRAMRYEPPTEPVKVLVLGASDKRYLPIHEHIFAGLLGSVDVTTYDIDQEHLGADASVIEHDVTQLFPQSGYGIIFSHELMKFLTPIEQFQMMKNANSALAAGGLAMHIMHEPSIKGTSELREWQYRVNPIDLEQKLGEYGISASRLEFKSDSCVDWLRDTTVLVTRKP